MLNLLPRKNFLTKNVFPLSAPARLCRIEGKENFSKKYLRVSCRRALLSPVTTKHAMQSTASLPAVAEYGSAVASVNLSGPPVILAEKIAMVCGKPRRVTLEHIRPGYVPAGSAMRLQSTDGFAVRWDDGRAIHGQIFRTMAEAESRFAQY